MTIDCVSTCVIVIKKASRFSTYTDGAVMPPEFSDVLMYDNFPHYFSQCVHMCRFSCHTSDNSCNSYSCLCNKYQNTLYSILLYSSAVALNLFVSKVPLLSTKTLNLPPPPPNLQKK